MPSSGLKAETRDDLMHGTAHFGGTYVLTDLTEMGCKAFKIDHDKVLCTALGVGLGIGANVAYKASEGFPKDTKRAILAGSAGAVFSGTINLLRW